MAYKITDEIRKKLIESHKGQIPWNKGLKGYLKGRKITWANKISQGKRNSLKSRLASQKAGKLMGLSNKGKKLSEERKRKLHEHNKKIGNKPPVRRGECSHFWKGGVSFELYTLDWTETLRESIRERDGFMCQECGVHQDELNRRLHIHHIDYDKKNCNPNNLISLCINCHMKTNVDRERWVNYFKKENYE